MTIEEALKILIDNGATIYIGGGPVSEGDLDEALAAAQVVGELASELGKGVSISLYDCPVNWLERADTTRLLKRDDRTWLSGRCLSDRVTLHSVDLEVGS